MSDLRVGRGVKIVKKQARKDFWPPSAMMGIGYFQNLFLRKCLDIFWNFYGFFLEFFWRNVLGGTFVGEMFGRNFWEEFFGRIFWEAF